jgi:acetoacetate decarboxylase
MPVLPSVCLRMIPGERGSSFAELIEVGSDARFKEVWEGPGSCHFTGASELDPWHRIPMREILTCRYAIADFELKQGGSSKECSTDVRQPATSLYAPQSRGSYLAEMSALGQ